MTVSFTETFLSRPGRLDEDPADVALACFCDTAAPAFVAAGVLIGNEADVPATVEHDLPPSLWRCATGFFRTSKA